MPQELPIQIELASGGFIPDIPENQELLSLIKVTPKLEPDQLASLAIFYEAYATTAALADHIMEIIGRQAVCALDWLGDSNEDYWCGYDATSEENREKALVSREKALSSGTFQVHPTSGHKGQLPSRLLAHGAAYEIRSVPYHVPGLNVLIETINGSNPHIIGFSPRLKDEIKVEN